MSSTLLTHYQKKNGGKTDAENISGIEKRGSCKAVQDKREILGQNLFVAGKKLKDGKMLVVVSKDDNENSIGDYIGR